MEPLKNHILNKEALYKQVPKPVRKPAWLKVNLPEGSNYRYIREMVSRSGLHTICESGRCPNLAECWGLGTATFMILGDICTRSCKFCATKTGRPLPPDNEEPGKVAGMVKELHLKHVVLTSVTRDDLPDGGAAIWADVIRKIRYVNPGVTIETLIPDFGGQTQNLQVVIDEKPDVISHNLETVERLTQVVRSGAMYLRSLQVLKQVADSGIVSKSGLMVGLGETDEEVLNLMDDLLNAGCSVLTIGQYLQPTKAHLPVQEYISPWKFENYKSIGLSKGFRIVESKPLVRSSYHAEKHI